jgi:uncharacterized FlgJ-related protein
MIKTILFLLMFTFLSTNTYEQEGKQLTEQELQTIRINWIKRLDFSLELFQELLSLYDVPYADYILRQAILETGNFTSDIFVENNNLLGMKHPRVRPTTSIGSNRNHAMYHHWTESVEDYLLWLEYYKDKGWSTEDYFKFLKEVGYAEDPLYIYKLQNLNFV